MTVIHETPGLIDIRAFTTFGVNAKPNATNPIGYFGTGLKFAVAVLCREGCEVTVWIGEEPYVFYSEKMQFRGVDFLQLRMKRRRGVTSRWMSQELPYTTELGRNWELWMAFRELHSNTLDEGGSSYASVPGEDEDGPGGAPGVTRIVVCGDAYAAVYAARDEVFLPGAADEASRVCVLRDVPSKYGYYRGLRATELRLQSNHTWCVYEKMELTEDRTLKYGFMFQYYAARAVMESHDAAFIDSVLKAEYDTFESTFEWENYSYTPTEEFLASCRKNPKRRTVYVYLEKVTPKPAPAPSTDWREELLILLREGDAIRIGACALRRAAALEVLLRASLRNAPPPSRSAEEVLVEEGPDGEYDEPFS